MIYICPESLGNPEIINFLFHNVLFKSLLKEIVFDEAHCILEFGYDNGKIKAFRKAYGETLVQLLYHLRKDARILLL